MPDALYDTDVFTWSERQADLLRRLAGGERVNAEIDWENVIEEVGDVGRSAVREVRSLLAQALEHLLKVHGWPDGPTRHWLAEAATFLGDAREEYTASMRQRLDLARLYARSRARISAMEVDGRPPRPLPPTCPFGVDQLLARDALPDVNALSRALSAERAD